MRQLDFFRPPRRPPVAKPRTLHMSDAGYGLDGFPIIAFRCAVCGHETGWVKARSPAAEADGRVCPVCRGGLGRLFVPLKREPFEALARGTKRWEARRARGAFLPARLSAGRAVELRLGYSGPRALAGRIGERVEAETIAGMVSAVPFRELVPWAWSAEAAVRLLAELLGDHPGPFVVFEVTGLEIIEREHP